jgi:hypothetical protein
MKVFKELEVAVPISRRVEFLSLLEENLPDGWKRDREAESRVPEIKNKEQIYFVCNSQGKRKAALVALVAKNSNVLYVSNIVPCEPGKLEHDQYNYILDEFATICVEKIAKQMNVVMIRSSGQESLENWISSDSAQKLRLFSALANKSTGTSHPLDKERWYEFVIALVKNNDSLDTSKLIRWLSEEENWAEDIANEMAIEFEQEVGLLEYFMSK